MALTRSPAPQQDLATPTLNALSAQPGMLPAAWDGPFGANQGLALARIMGNQAMLALTGLRDDGVGGVESALCGGVDAAAAWVEDVPVLGTLAGAAAAHNRQQRQAEVGAIRGGIDLATGLVGAVSNPIGLGQGLADLFAHAPGTFHLQHTAAVAADVARGEAGLGDLARAGLTGVLDPTELPPELQAYWGRVGAGLAEPYTKAVKQGRGMEAGGRLFFDLLSNLAPGAMVGKVATATKAAGATGRSLALLDDGASAARAASLGAEAKLGGLAELSDDARLASAGADLDVGKISEKLDPGGLVSLEDNALGALDGLSASADNLLGEVWPPNADMVALLDREITASAARMAAVPELAGFDVNRFRAASRMVEANKHQRLVAERLMRSNGKLTLEQAMNEALLRPAFMEDGGMVVSEAIKAPELAEITQHESIHTVAHSAMRAAPSMPLNEGITQWITNKLLGGVGEGYPRHVPVVQSMADLIGGDGIIRAYVTGGRRQLASALDQAAPGSAAQLLQELDGIHWGQANVSP